MPYINKKKSKQQVQTDKQRKRRKIYNSALWNKMRLAQLQSHPICQICKLEGKTTLGIDTHHLDSFINYDGMEMMNKAYDSNNLISLCKECHNRIHNGDLRGCKSLEEIKKRILYGKNKGNQ